MIRVMVQMPLTNAAELKNTRPDRPLRSHELRESLNGAMGQAEKGEDKWPKCQLEASRMDLILAQLYKAIRASLAGARRAKLLGTARVAEAQRRLEEIVLNHKTEEFLEWFTL